mmetsp:Transcript_5032/g.15018  ORF Transcript_5032/g.15018 Transcript_5032/m.15018 type:complete len:232 (-) Transcript_5032:69-764(-)
MVAGGRSRGVLAGLGHLRIGGGTCPIPPFEELHVALALVDKLVGHAPSEIGRGASHLQLLELQLGLHAVFCREDVQLVPANVRASPVHVREEPPHAGVHADVIRPDFQRALRRASLRINEPAVRHGARVADVADVGDVIRTHVPLPLVHPERVDQVPAPPVAGVLGVVLRNQVVLGLLPVVVRAQVRLALGADLQRVHKGPAAVLVHQRLEHRSRNRDERLGRHLRRNASQ